MSLRHRVYGLHSLKAINGVSYWLIKISGLLFVTRANRWKFKGKRLECLKGLFVQLNVEKRPFSISSLTTIEWHSNSVFQ